MTSPRTDNAGQFSRIVLMVLACGAWAMATPANGADDPPCAARNCAPAGSVVALGPPPAPGATSGFQGFGLGYHLKHGYGGNGLGVGANGGYPFYGGPGYLHPNPPLRRLKRIVPFPYYGGPGGPSPGQPYFYGGVGSLVPNPQVISIIGERGGTADFGPATGAIPYPESTFAPFAADTFENTNAPVRVQPGSVPGAMPPGAR